MVVVSTQYVYEVRRKDKVAVRDALSSIRILGCIICGERRGLGWHTCVYYGDPMPQLRPPLIAVHAWSLTLFCVHNKYMWYVQTYIHPATPPLRCLFRSDSLYVSSAVNI